MMGEFWIGCLCGGGIVFIVALLLWLWFQAELLRSFRQ